MRERSATITILYPEGFGMDNLALVILDKMSEFVINLDTVHDHKTTFSDPSDADESNWEDYFWDGVDAEDDMVYDLEDMDDHAE